VPRRTIECDEVLHTNGLYSAERVSEIKMDLVPLEEDLLSLELPNNFQHHLLQDDDTYKVYVQNSLRRLEDLLGPIKFKLGLGRVSK
jgi:hypothetical protein